MNDVTNISLTDNKANITGTCNKDLTRACVRVCDCASACACVCVCVCVRVHGEIPELGAYLRNYSFELLNSGTEQIQTLRGTNASSLEFSKDEYINSVPFENWSLSEANDEEKDERNKKTHRKTKQLRQRKETEEKKERQERQNAKKKKKRREEQRTLTYFFANIAIAICAPEVAPLTVRL